MERDFDGADAAGSTRLQKSGPGQFAELAVTGLSEIQSANEMNIAGCRSASCRTVRI
jgi:hypothetical protein